jgi:hypothetical protein
MGTATTLAAIDVVYVPAGRIRWTYALDAAREIRWIVLWLRGGRASGHREGITAGIATDALGDGVGHPTCRPRRQSL